MATASRAQRISDELLKVLSTALRNKIRNPKLTTAYIIDVEISKDLSFAKVYYSFSDEKINPEAVNQALIKSIGFFRSYIAQEISLRIVPQLKFINDTSSKQGSYMDSLIRRAITEDAKIIKEEE